MSCARKCRRVRRLTVLGLISLEPRAAIRLAPALIRRLEAAVVGFIAIAVAAARIVRLEELALDGALAHIGVLLSTRIGVTRSQPFAAVHALRHRGQSVGTVGVLAPTPLALAAALALRLVLHEEAVDLL